MFERLINSFGQVTNPREAELQLAAAVLLFGVLPVDYIVTQQETSALRKALVSLFGYSPEKCRRAISRAASAYARDRSIVAATTMLKHRTSDQFRLRLMHEVRNLSRADGVLHDNEHDLEQRIERLLGLAQDNLQKSA